MRIIYVLIVLAAGSLPLFGEEPRPATTGVEVASAAVMPQFPRTRAQSPGEKEMERERVKGLNKDRQQKLKNDTDRLLQLATELKDYVDKTNENILSVSVIKKAEEIEKLAKSVKEKMKTAYQGEQENPLPGIR